MKATLLKLISQKAGNCLPPSSIYFQLLQIVGATNENRKQYGKFTINQWNELLYNN